MKKKLILITLVLTAIAAVPFVYAAGPHGPGRGGHGGAGMHEGFGPGFGGLGMLGHLGRVADELDLTDAQKEQIHAIFKETREQNAEYREAMHGTMKNVAAKLLANPNDVAGAQSILDQQAAAEKALKTNMLNAASRALNVLTPEQRAKLAEMLAEHATRMEGRRK